MKIGSIMKAVAVLGLLTAAAPAVAQTKVTLLYTPTVTFVSAFVAKDQGFFANHGVDVDLQIASNGSVMIAGVVSGSAQVGLPTPTVAFQAIENGMDLRAFASTNIFPDETAAGLVVGTDSGITTAKDLEGKRVGVPGLGGLLDVTMRKWASSNGADLSKVNIVEVLLAQTADALRAKQVDAVASVDPFASRAVDTGAGTLIGNYLDVITPGSVGGVFVTSAEWAEANADAVRGMQLALDEALEYIKANDASARESLARYTTLPPEVVANIKMGVLSTHLEPEKSLRFWNDLSKEQGLIQNDIDLEKFVIRYPGE